MTEKITEHIDRLLEDAPRTRRVIDLREELLSGCLDKYADLTTGGMTPEEAYKTVIAEIGDIHELLGETVKRPADKRLLGAASSSLWSLITLIYLCFGFLLHLWHPAWLIFPFGAFLQNLLGAALAEPGRRKGHVNAALYTGAATLFLALGIFTGFWAAACLIFAFAVAVQQMLRLAQLWRDDR